MSVSALSLLSKDDWIYAGILGGAFLLSILVRFLARGQSLYAVLKYSPGFIGFGAALALLGWKIVYSIPIALFTTFSIKNGKPGDNHQMPLLVFVVVFIYLLLTRHLHEFIDVPELASQANALQLIITLRAIGLAFDVGDSRFDRANPGQSKRKRHLEEDPSYLMMFNYLYHYCGLFTGPYYSFQMFLDSCDSNASAFHQNYLDKGLVGEYTWRLKQLAWSLPIFIITNKLFPLDGLRSDDVFEWSLLYKLIYACMVFVVFRMRVYAAWSVSECICVTLNIGIYPDGSAPKCVIGPTDVDGFRKGWTDGATSANSLAIQNIEIAQVEASDGFRAGIRGWNKSVQTWLALYVHSRAPKASRMVLTMFISALWHGTYAGYFMSFLVVPMCTAAEDVLFRLVPKGDNGERSNTFFRVYWLTLRTRGFDFMATGFLLKNWKDTHRFWSSCYYWLPVTMIVLFFVLTAIEPMMKTKRPRAEETKDAVKTK
ncbi:mboa-7 [Pristionchus pacificus]|uniref:Lysophospholipid acyltransferase 7 n=1 Tax=Pristionchus pacificus TaxID=54126 RepID=A0A2A6BHG6_PRIPA|nr:mboa-7 [Pristionchus pacificus]|eukprot:PDM65288.1 mboa-7 [Pristionchus pacificus]